MILVTAVMKIKSEHFQTFFKEIETYLLEAPKIEVATIK